MQVTVDFTDAEWERVTLVMASEGIPQTAAGVGQWFRTAMKGMVHRFERNKAFDTMQTSEDTRQEADTWIKD